jgi:DNA end-binding protein Ku
VAYSYKTAIAFGLVFIPVTLTAAIREHDIGFNLLERNSLSRVKYKKTCVNCGGREIDNSDIVKGFQFERDKYVIFTDADFEAIKSEKDKQITIIQFVDLSEIDPIFFDRAFYVEPTGGEKAFALLAEALTREGKAGVAKVVLGTRDTLLVIRAREGVLIANTLYFFDEVKKAPARLTVKNGEEEIALATNLINNMKKEWKPHDFHDEYTAKLQAAIDQKIYGLDITASGEPRQGNVINLLDALKRSVEISTTPMLPRVASKASPAGMGNEVTRRVTSRPR